MSWLSGGLSQFTDQISTFTKEVLTETTEEVEDPAAELQVAKRKINDLESLNKHIQSEWEKLKAHNDELTERAETAEYQISTISQEYRKLIQERDEELRRLKVANETLKEQHKVLGGNDDVQSPLKELAKVNFFENENVLLLNGLENVNMEMGEDLEDHSRMLGEEFHDFGDVISSQGEINRLQSELANVKRECEHWKRAAREKGISDAEIVGSESDMLLLRNQVEELQQSLKREMEQHQRELTALQRVHAEQLYTLSQRHQNEIDQLQYQIDHFQKNPIHGSQPTFDLDSRMEDELKLRIAELEKTQADYQHTKEQLEKLTMDNLKLSDANAHLTSELERENLKTSQLRDELETLKDHFTHEKETQLQQLVVEKQTLTLRLSEMEASIKEQEVCLSNLQSEYKRSQSEVEQLNNQVEKLSHNTKEKEAEVVLLKGVLSSDGEEKEKTSMELSRALLELEEVRHRVREQEKEIVKLDKLLCTKEEEVSCLKGEIETRKATEDSLSAKCVRLDCLLSQEREVSKQHQVDLDSLRKTLQPGVLQEELTKTKTNLVSELQKTLLERETLEERDVLAQTREKLRQTELKLAEVTSTMQELNGIVRDLKPQVSSLESTKEHLETKIQTIEALSHTQRRELQDKLENKHQECVKSSKQLSELRAHLIEVEEGYTQDALRADEREKSLKQKIAELQTKLKGINMQENAQSSQLTQLQLETLQEQLLIAEEQRDDALLQMSNAQEQAEQNAAALQNLENVLEQFQRDKSTELASALKRTQSELADALEKCKMYDEAQAQLKTQLADASSAAETASLLNVELEAKENEIARLTKEMESLRVSFTKQLEQQNDAMDRSLVKNLVLGYIHTTDRKKPEVLQLIGKILEFSPEELEEAKGVAAGNIGWLGGFWKKPTTTTTSNKADSLSQVFVKFLESESLPKPRPLQSLIATTTTSSGYIDPKSDPDRPSLATAAVLSPPTTHHSSNPLPSQLYSSISPIPKLETNVYTTATQAGNSNTNQSSLLKNVLSE